MAEFELFKRAAKLNVHGRVLEGLHFEFQVIRSLKASQNTCDVKMYNLAPNTRKFLQEQTKGVILELHAGYEGQSPLPRIFLGQLRQITTERDGADWVTLISSGDGDKEKKKGVSFSLGPGTSLERAAKEIMKQIGGKVGNLASALKNARFTDGAAQFAESFTAYGNGDKELGKLLGGAGLEHSWQNGELQVLTKDSALNATAVTLNQGTGLVGSPELGVSGDKVKFRSLLNAEIFPGRIVHIQSANLDGFFRVDKAQYTGGIHLSEWYVDCEGLPRK